MQALKGRTRDGHLDTRCQIKNSSARTNSADGSVPSLRFLLLATLRGLFQTDKEFKRSSRSNKYSKRARSARVARSDPRTAKVPSQAASEEAQDITLSLGRSTCHKSRGLTHWSKAKQINNLHPKFALPESHEREDWSSAHRLMG